jgi:hypothetical protein
MKIPGVVYVPLVGKVTVAMLERNLMRLYEQFHHPDVQHRQAVLAHTPWYGHSLHLYTAAMVTLLVALQLQHVRK